MHYVIVLVQCILQLTKVPHALMLQSFSLSHTQIDFKQLAKASGRVWLFLTTRKMYWRQNLKKIQPIFRERLTLLKTEGIAMADVIQKANELLLREKQMFNITPPGLSFLLMVKIVLVLTNSVSCPMLSTWCFDWLSFAEDDFNKNLIVLTCLTVQHSSYLTF